MIEKAASGAATHPTSSSRAAPLLVWLSNDQAQLRLQRLVRRHCVALDYQSESLFRRGHRILSISPRNIQRRLVSVRPLRDWHAVSWECLELAKRCDCPIAGT
jgi:hypothetical protein